MKIITWVAIAIALYLLFMSFTSNDTHENQIYSYQALIAVAIGYACNFINKKTNKAFKEENEEK